jgi:hypothetical protein
MNKVHTCFRIMFHDCMLCFYRIASHIDGSGNAGEDVCCVS